MRQRGDVLNVLMFFVIVVTMFPLGVGPDKDTLRLIAPGVVWVAALLSAILSLGRLFALDYADGTLGADHAVGATAVADGAGQDCGALADHRRARSR